MTPKTDLFELIKSMNKNEKGYFKRICTRQGGEKKYILLFDFIEQQNEYNEDQILKTFKKEKFIRNFSVAKSYLYTTLLDCLHNYHADISSETTLNRMFHYVEVLYNKGLYKQCEDILKKIYKTAKTYEKYYHILQYHTWNLKLLNTVGFKKTEKKQLEYVVDSINSSLELFGLSVQNNLLGNQLVFLISSEGDFSRKDIEGKMKKIIEMLNQKNFETNDFTKIRILQKMVALYKTFYVEKNIDESITNIKECINLFHSKKELIGEDLGIYITLHINMLVVSARTPDDSLFYSSLSSLRKIPFTYKNKLPVRYHANIFEHTYVSELGYYILKAQFEKITSMIPEIEKGLEKYGKLLNEIDYRILIANTGLMLYGNNDYKLALKWFNKLLNIEDFITRPDVIAIAKMLSIIIHYELGNYDVAASQCRSTLSFINKYEVLSEVEIKVLKHIKWAVKNNYHNTEVEQKVKLLSEEIEHYPATIYFDYNAWLLSQTERISYSRALKKMNKIKMA